MLTTSKIGSFLSKLITITMEDPMQIKGGAELATIFYIFSLPTKFMEAPMVVVNTQVDELKSLVTLNPIP
jgi:hypothetical protein